MIKFFAKKWAKAKKLWELESEASTLDLRIVEHGLYLEDIKGRIKQCKDDQMQDAEEIEQAKHDIKLLEEEAVKLKSATDEEKSTEDWKEKNKSLREEIDRKKQSIEFYTGETAKRQDEIKMMQADLGAPLRQPADWKPHYAGEQYQPGPNAVRAECRIRSKALRTISEHLRKNG